MKLEFIEQLNFDLVEGDSVNPWQCEFDISQTRANYFMISIDKGIRSELFEPSKVGFPVLFGRDNLSPTDLQIVASGTVVRVESKNYYYKRATLIGFDVNDGAEEDEMEAVIVDDSGVSEFGLVLDGTMISTITGDVTVNGGDIKINCNKPISGTNGYVYYMDINGVRYYGKVPCNIDGANTINLDRFVTMFKYKI